MSLITFLVLVLDVPAMCVCVCTVGTCARVHYPLKTAFKPGLGHCFDTCLTHMCVCVYACA